MERPIKQSVTEGLKLPRDLILGEVNIRISGRSLVYIENYRYIIEYSEEVLKLQCKNIKLRILGKKLVLDYFSRDEMMVRGVINEISYY